MPLVGPNNLFCLRVPIPVPHWQLTGEGDGLAGAVVALMEFHRPNLGFLACKGLSRRD